MSMSLIAASQNHSMSSSARFNSSSKVSMPCRSMNLLSRLRSTTSRLGSHITSPITTGCMRLIVATRPWASYRTTSRTAWRGSSIRTTTRPQPRSSRRQPCSTTSVSGDSCCSSRLECAMQMDRSAPRSSERFSSRPHARGAEPFLDSLGVLQQEPVVVPRGARDGQRQVWPGAQAHGPCRLVLRVAPAVPSAFDRRLDQLHPRRLVTARHRRGKGEHLPPAVFANDREYRLAARPVGVTNRAWILRVGRHQPLLHGEDQLVRGVECCGWQRWVAATEPDLQSPNRLAQSKRGFAFVVQPQHLYVIEQMIGLGEKDASLRLRGHLGSKITNT